MSILHVHVAYLLEYTRVFVADGMITKWCPEGALSAHVWNLVTGTIPIWYLNKPEQALKVVNLLGPECMYIYIYIYIYREREIDR